MTWRKSRYRATQIRLAPLDKAPRRFKLDSRTCAQSAIAMRKRMWPPAAIFQVGARNNFRCCIVGGKSLIDARDVETRYLTYTRVCCALRGLIGKFFSLSLSLMCSRAGFNAVVYTVHSVGAVRCCERAVGSHLAR